MMVSEHPILFERCLSNHLLFDFELSLLLRLFLCFLSMVSFLKLIVDSACFLSFRVVYDSLVLVSISFFVDWLLLVMVSV